MRLRLLIMTAAVVLAAGFACLPLPATAAPTSSAGVLWATPILLYSSHDYTSSPAVISDSAGDVHVLFTVNRRSGDTLAGGRLTYLQLHNGRWSTPTEVVVAPDGGRVDQIAAAIDSQGVLHVLFDGGRTPEVYYTRAHVADASSVFSWSTPVRISTRGSANGTLGTVDSIAVGPDDALHVAYAGENGNLYYRRSTTGGRYWQSPVTVANTAGLNAGADHPRIAANERGDLYLAWTQLQRPEGWPPVGTFFARSMDGGGTWSEPARVAAAGTGAPNVVSAGPMVHRVWDTVAEIGQRWHQSSTDGGQTWSVPEQVAPALKGGFTGYPGLAVDSAGRLHVVTSVDGGQRAPLRAGVYHVIWDGRQWSQPTRISEGTIGKQSVEMPRLAVSNGNRLHAVYEDDFQRIWYTTALADAPTIPPLPVPAPADEGDLFAVPVPTVAAVQATPGPRPTAGRVAAPNASAADEPTTTLPPIHPLALASLPTAVLIAVLIGRRVARWLD